MSRFIAAYEMSQPGTGQTAVANALQVALGVDEATLLAHGWDSSAKERLLTALQGPLAEPVAAQPSGGSYFIGGEGGGGAKSARKPPAKKAPPASEAVQSLAMQQMGEMMATNTTLMQGLLEQMQEMKKEVLESRRPREEPSHVASGRKDRLIERKGYQNSLSLLVLGTSSKPGTTS